MSAAEAGWPSPPAFESGGGGLVSTVDDYLAFGRMMLNNGKYGDERILSRPSVELMTTDQITPRAEGGVQPFFPGFWDSHGWGFGLAIDTRRDDLRRTPGRFGWDGGYGTSVVRRIRGGNDRDPDDAARLGRVPDSRRSISISGPRPTRRSTTEAPLEHIGERGCDCARALHAGHPAHCDGLTKEHLCCTFNE